MSFSSAYLSGAPILAWLLICASFGLVTASLFQPVWLEVSDHIGFGLLYFQISSFGKEVISPWPYTPSTMWYVVYGLLSIVLLIHFCIIIRFIFSFCCCCTCLKGLVLTPVNVTFQAICTILITCAVVIFSQQCEAPIQIHMPRFKKTSHSLNGSIFDYSCTLGIGMTYLIVAVTLAGISTGISIGFIMCERHTRKRKNKKDSINDFDNIEAISEIEQQHH
eukprot:Awhi_evm1s7133